MGQQATDKFSQALFVSAFKFEKFQSYRFRSNGADHGRFNQDRRLVLKRSQSKVQKGTLGERRRGAECASAHRDVRDHVFGLSLCPHNGGVDVGGKAVELSFVGRRCGAVRADGHSSIAMRAQLTAKKMYREAGQYPFHLPGRADAASDISVAPWALRLHPTSPSTALPGHRH